MERKYTVLHKNTTQRLGQISKPDLSLPHSQHKDKQKTKENNGEKKNQCIFYQIRDSDIPVPAPWVVGWGAVIGHIKVKS